LKSLDNKFVRFVQSLLSPYCLLWSMAMGNQISLRAQNNSSIMKFAYLIFILQHWVQPSLGRGQVYQNARRIKRRGRGRGRGRRRTRWN